jgi:hypothetical protein
MGMPRAIEKGKRPSGVTSVVSSGTQKGNMGTSHQYKQTGPKYTGPNYMQRGPAKAGIDKC